MSKKTRFLALSIICALCLTWTVVAGTLMSADGVSNFDGTWAVNLTGDSGTSVNYEIKVSNGAIVSMFDMGVGQPVNGSSGSVFDGAISGVQIVINMQNTTASLNLMLAGQWVPDKTMISGTYTGVYKTANRTDNLSGNFYMKPISNTTQPTPDYTPGYTPTYPTDYTPYTPGYTPPKDYTPGYTPTPNYTPSYPTPTPTNPFGTPTPTTDNSSQPIQIRVMNNNQQVSVVNIGESFNVDVKVQLPSGSSGGIAPGTPVDPYVSIYSNGMGWEVFLVMDLFGNISLSQTQAPIISSWSASAFDWATITTVVVPNDPLYAGTYQLRGRIVPAGADIASASPSTYELTIQGNSSTSGGTPTPDYPATPDYTPTPYYPPTPDYTPSTTPYYPPNVTPNYPTPYYPATPIYTPMPSAR